MSYLNLTLIFEGSNLNYGEGIGNILSLKKISSKGKNFSYISRQALRYDIVRMMNELYQIPYTEVNKAKGVVQFIDSAKISDYPEIDFFGYMKTSKKEEGNSAIRKAVVRLSDAVSLEAFNNEMEFATNKGLADRIPNNNGNDIFQSEIHKSFYSYTVTVELDKIGIDGDIKISQDEKSKRIKMLLEILKILYRDIRGKRENLSPVFVIGGIYEVGNPFFYNRIQLTFTKDKILLNKDILTDILNITVKEKKIADQTKIGFLKGIFSNLEEIGIKENEEIKDIKKLSINDFFTELEKEVKLYYKNQKG